MLLDRYQEGAYYLAMKVKVGTTLESALYERVLNKAKEQGLRVNEVIEAALQAYLSSDGGGVDFVAESFGSYRVADDKFDEIAESDIYET